MGVKRSTGRWKDLGDEELIGRRACSRGSVMIKEFGDVGSRGFSSKDDRKSGEPSYFTARVMEGDVWEIDKLDNICSQSYRDVV